MTWLRRLGMGLLTFAACYGLPNALEYALLHAPAVHVSPWVASVALGDVVGCWFLYRIGLRRLAVAVYLAATLSEAVLLAARLVTPAQMVWITDLAPGLVAAAVVMESMERCAPWVLAT